ncbi:MAG: hypothetical protein HY707_00180 [Ignavibacteriae bacterium]|nr:hypothetical protein [Ignavibacteriota bacterium]
MKQALKYLKPATAEFLRSYLRSIRNSVTANAEMREFCGIDSFFPTQSDYRLFLEHLKLHPEVSERIARREYGDFQTPPNLTDKVCTLLRSQEITPSVLIEPTFGKGSFILSALQVFPVLKRILGVEIYEPYCWHTKFTIVELFVDNPKLNRPFIQLFCDDVFKFDFQDSLDDIKDQRILVLGNPPWVTNSELSALNSANLPTKSNFKSFNGLDAITGKGNFDIGEYIILMMLNAFAKYVGWLAMLAKNSVIKNVLQDLPKTGYHISNLSAIRFDAKLHFNASVEASLFRCTLGQRQDQLTCKVATLDSPNVVEGEFGWIDQKFVSDISTYQETRIFDGSSPLVWRQGVKHDCSRILELDFVEGKFRNGFNELLDIEDDLIFPLVKSSDIQNSLLVEARKFAIITQKKVGEDTAFIAQTYPKLNKYLSNNIQFFSERKSSIYNGKSPYAIFGIGDYSFKPYKVAISGLYKKSQFSLIQPVNDKPVMLDDTCYFLGFDHQAHAVVVLTLLNSDPVQRLLRSLSFLDSKRPYTKDLLMRIDLIKVAENLGFDAVRRLANQLPETLSATFTRDKWNEFLTMCVENAKVKSQPSFFDEPSAFPSETITNVV